MRISLIIAEQDLNVLEHLQSYFDKNHRDDIELVTMTRAEILKKYLENHGTDVLLMDDQFGLKASELADACSRIAYLTADQNASHEDAPSFFKFKRTDLLYKDVVSLYADAAPSKRSNAENAKVQASGIRSGDRILVTSFSGGTGSTTIAAAMARSFAAKGESTIYLNFEKAGASEVLFHGDGEFTFDEILYTLKEHGNLPLKISSCVRTDRSGVDFFTASTEAMYMLEFTEENRKELLETLGTSMKYSRIVVTEDFSLSAETVRKMAQMDHIIVVTDGTMTANSKFVRVMAALPHLEEQEKVTIRDRMRLIYNRFQPQRDI